MILKLENDNGEIIAERKVPRGTILSDIIVQTDVDVIATKVWTMEDVRKIEKELEYPEAEYLKGRFKFLEECNDYDWEGIKDVVVEAHRASKN